MRLINLTAFKITLVFLAGILCSHYFNFAMELLQGAVVMVSGVLIITWWRSKKMIFQDGVFASVSFIALFIFGAWVYQLHQPLNHSTHYAKENLSNKNHLFQLKIKSQLKPDLFNEKYIASVQAIEGKSVTGDILLLVAKDSATSGIEVDDQLLLVTNFQELPLPKNPYQFNYAAYLNQLGIYNQFRIKKEEIVKSFKGKSTLRGMTFSIRKKINTHLIEDGFSGNPLALINALLLGQRQELSQEVYSDFAKAGAVHILAVSGLHVGIIMLILQFLFNPLERLPKGKTLKIICVVLCLWIFAVIAGLSPSVLRAVTMFSFLVYALESNRETSTFNTLLVSAFVLLAIDPNLIFQIGFQMSYLAVFAIIWINPMLQKLYRPKTIIDRKIWEITTVSFSAQLGVSVLSIYYFNHFPGLFFLTNLVVLPFLGLLLGLGILIIFLSAIKALPAFLTESYSSLLEALVAFINWAANQRSFYFDSLSFSKAEVIFLYVVIIASILILQKFSGKRVMYFLTSVILLQLVIIWQKKENTHQEMVIFHKTRTTILGFKNDDFLHLYSNLNERQINNEKLIKNYKTKAKITKTKTDTIRESFQYGDKMIVIIDSLSIYPTTKNGVDIVLLRNSPRVHLERMIDSLKPKKIIADGSNYTTYVNRWRESCKKRKLPFHHTGKEGAYILE